MTIQYSDYRKNIKSGDLLVWSHRGWKSWHDIKVQMVRFFTQSEYSHVGIAWVIGDRVFVIEAVEPCVRIYPLSKLGDFYHIKMGAEWKPETEEAALSYVGSDYKQLEAIKLYFKPWHKGQVSECAALVLQIMSVEGIDLGDRATPDAVVLQAQLYGHPTLYVTNK
jgi:hypothetical protein